MAAVNITLMRMRKSRSGNIYNHTNIFVTGGYRHKRRKQIYLFPALWADMKNRMTAGKGLIRVSTLSGVHTGSW